MVFQHAAVRVPDGQRMLRTNDELVGVARVLEVVDNVADKDSKDVESLDLGPQVAYGEKIVHGLQRIHNVVLVVVRVLLEVPQRDFLRKVEDGVY